MNAQIITIGGRDVRVILAQWVDDFQGRQSPDSLLAEWANSRNAAVTRNGDLHIADPMNGHWLNDEKAADFVRWLIERGHIDIQDGFSTSQQFAVAKSADAIALCMRHVSDPSTTPAAALAIIAGARRRMDDLEATIRAFSVDARRQSCDSKSSR